MLSTPFSKQKLTMIARDSTYARKTVDYEEGHSCLHLADIERRQGQDCRYNYLEENYHP